MRTAYGGNMARNYRITGTSDNPNYQPIPENCRSRKAGRGIKYRRKATQVGVSCKTASLGDRDHFGGTCGHVLQVGGDCCKNLSKNRPNYEFSMFSHRSSLDCILATEGKEIAGPDTVKNTSRGLLLKAV